MDRGWYVKNALDVRVCDWRENGGDFSRWVTSEEDKPDKKAVLFKVDKELIRQEGTQRYQKRMN